MTETAKKVKRMEDKTGYYGPLKVMLSNAGYYIGRSYTHTSGELKNLEEPGTRESGYYASREAAQAELDDCDWAYRYAPENLRLYDDV